MLGSAVAVIALAGAGCAKPSPANTTTNTQATTTGTNSSALSARTVTIQGFAFSPATLTVKKGAAVTWTNQDSADHTITGDAGGPSSGTIASGQSYSFTFDSAGAFPYHCSIHPSMTGTVTVTE